MENRKYKYGFVVGAFIVVALSVFILTIFTLGGEQKSFSKKIYIKVVFNEINGLKEGNNVWFNGVKIGTVKKIELLNPSSVEVILNIEKKSQPFIKKDAFAKISSDGFLGNKVVVIYGGSANMPSVTGNAYLQMQKDSASSEDMMATLQLTNRNLLIITNDIKSITQQIKTGNGMAGRLIYDSSMANNLQLTLSAFRTAATSAKLSLMNVENFTKRVNTNTSSVNQLFTDTTLFDSIKFAILQAKSMMQAANKMAENLNLFSNDISVAAKNLLDTTNSAGTILNNKKTADDIKDVIQNLKTASKKLDEDFEALRSNFLFRRYFKQKAKNN